MGDQKNRQKIMKQITKKILKSDFAYMLVTFLIYLYMYLIYFTTRWTYVFPENYDENYIKNTGNIILVLWHDKIMIFPHISPIKLHLKYNPLVSPHNDGKIISNVMKMLGWKIIEGSTNKNSLQAIREIMRNLKNNLNVIITPDGPRGPRHKINSNLIQIAKKTNSQLIPLSVKASNYFNLNSWDKLIFPKPFGKIEVRFGKPITHENLGDVDNKKLATILNNLDL